MPISLTKSATCSWSPSSIDTPTTSSPLFVLTIEINEPRRLDPARRAPSGPEVQHNYLSAKVGKLHRAPIQRLEFKVRGRLERRVITNTGCGGLRMENSEDPERAID